MEAECLKSGDREGEANPETDKQAMNAASHYSPVFLERFLLEVHSQSLFVV